MNKRKSTAASKNPMIGSTPSETIDNVVGGEPIDSIKFGRELLGQCCTDELQAAGSELGGKAVRHG